MVTQNLRQKLFTISLALTMSVVWSFPYVLRAQESPGTASQVAPALTTADPTVEDLNRALQEKQDQQKLLQDQLQRYQDIIAEKQKVSASLKNELELLDAQVSKAELDLQTLDFSIEAKRIEIESAQLAVDQKQKDIDTQQSYLADLVRTINRYDQQDPLELLVVHSSFSEVVNDIRATATMQDNVSRALSDLQNAKTNLEREKADRERNKRELEGLQQDVATAVNLLDAQKDYKSKILTDTNSSEQQYGQLLEQSKQEQLAADSDIRALEEKVKSKLQGPNSPSSSTNEDFSTFTGNRDVQLAWPASPTKGISAYFHDPSYPYRRYFEHPAIDIPTPQGTAIAAADDGYVARTMNGGMGYSYILLVHSNSISTVYGHMSQINIAEDTFVKKGQIIGLSGGMPGTPGAGRLTTGAHLHFEVRLNGIPVNPLDYLP
jgi:murein DD-endopeptidase MepM/ murein hydrolase activator NlpD